MKKRLLSVPESHKLLCVIGILFSLTHLVCYVTAAALPREEGGFAVLSLLLTGLLLLLCLMTARLDVSQSNRERHKQKCIIAVLFLVLQGIHNLAWLRFGWSLSTSAGGLSLGIFGLMGSAAFLVFCLSNLRYLRTYPSE